MHRRDQATIEVVLGASTVRSALLHGHPRPCLAIDGELVRGIGASNSRELVRATQLPAVLNDRGRSLRRPQLSRRVLRRPGLHLGLCLGVSSA